MDKEKRQENEQELMERFDREVRQTFLAASNEYREEHGFPLITEDDVKDIDALSELKAKFSGNEEKEEHK